MGRLNAFRPARRRGARGFTLIELLVVLVIIAVLAALLLPAFARAQRQAKTLKCAANMGSWGSALFLYVNDHDGMLPQQDTSTLSTTSVPGSSNWQEAIAPYLVGGVASATSGLRFTMRTRYPCPMANSVNAGSSMYAMSGYLDPILYNHAPPKFLGIPNKPNFLLIADTISFYDLKEWTGNAGIQYLRHRLSSAYTSGDGRANFFFADGHSELLSYPQAMARNIQTLPQ